jgi:hypothetical protein
VFSVDDDLAVEELVRLVRTAGFAGKAFASVRISRCGGPQPPISKMISIEIDLI